MTLPAATRRLFPGYDEADLAPVDPGRRGSSPLFCRLLEDGDAADLAWLFASVPAPEVVAWLARHGGRRLTRRSRAFWEIVLGRPASPLSPTGCLLWPL